jgi:competence protein ComFC
MGSIILMSGLVLIKNIFTAFINFLFPSQCVVCKAPISFTDNCLCLSCLKNINYLSTKCELCSGEIHNGYCTICSNKKWYVSRNLTLAEYTGTMKEVLHIYKFKGRKRLHKRLSELAYSEIIGEDLDYDLLTTVPMSRAKKWKRGYNQSELIARDLAHKTGKGYRSILVERHGSRSQKELRYKERFLNILDRFKIKNISAVKGKRILLVDDVITTGATINECARILKLNGAVEVYSLTVARALINDFNRNQ